MAVMKTIKKIFFPRKKMSLSELCIFVVPYNKIAQNHDVRDYVDLVTKG